MNYIAIDTSGNHLTVIAKKGEKICTHFEENCGVKHSTALMPAVERVIAEADLKLNELDFIACVVGAGSFTGIRIGVATVKALCFALSIPALSITSFDTLSYCEKGERFAVIDAGHNGYYVCGYDKDDNVVFPPEYMLEDDLKGVIEGKKVVSYTDIESIGAKKVNTKDGLILAIEKKKDSLISPDDLSPLYCRKSQAEEGR